MFQRSFRVFLGTASLLVLLLLLLSRAPAQDKDKKDKEPPPREEEREFGDEGYRRFFKKPKTPAEYWDALKFEIEVGKYDLAALLLRGMLTKSLPTDRDLVELEEKDGMIAFLRLRNIPKWSEDPKLQKQAEKDVEELIKLVTVAVKKHLSDPKRIAKYVKNLNATPEERDFALKELYRPGAVVVPYLINELRGNPGPEKLNILFALRKLSAEVVPPILAALDCNEPELQADLIDVLVQRRAVEAVPFLWFLSGSDTNPPQVRQKASKALAAFLNVPESTLMPAKLALTREAEKYYQHQVLFADPRAVPVWRWDGKTVVLSTVPATKAEEYYGVKFANQALTIDPTYQPAQIVLTSLILDKTYPEIGLGTPLAKGAPNVHDILATSNPDLLVAVLDRALTDRKVPVILGVVRTLGELAEVRTTRPTGRGMPALVRALNYPDRRVHFASAEALLNVPNVATTQQTSRIVEVLRRALAADPGTANRSRILVGVFSPDLARRIADSVKEAGFEAVIANTGREVLQRLNKASDIDVLLLDEALPDPGLSSLLSQLRADRNAGTLPILLTPTLEKETELRQDALQFRNETLELLDQTVMFVERFSLAQRQKEEAVKDYLDKFRTQARQRVDQLLKDVRALPLRVSSPDANLKRLGELYRNETLRLLTEVRVAVGREPEIAKDTEDAATRAFFRFRQAALEALATARRHVERFPSATEDREDYLRRYAERFRNVTVMPAHAVLDPRNLQFAFLGRTVDPDAPPLNEAEMKEYTDKSIRYLARLARGEPSGFDVRPAAEVVFNAMHSGRLTPEGQLAAVEVMGRIPTARAQTELAHVVLGKAPLNVRIAAVGELVRHIQQNTPGLSSETISNLENLYAQVNLDAGLKTSLAPLLGSLRPDARRNGEKLLRYQPDLRENPPKEIPPPKEGQPKEDKDK
jgi:CheY-like chemotaxis protein